MRLPSARTLRRAGVPLRRREPHWARDLHDGGHPWLLVGDQRGNPAAGIPDLSEGNDVRALVDGRAYLSALAAALSRAGGDVRVLFAGWRTDADELLEDGGPSLAGAFAAAVARGAVVRGLVWRSHPKELGYSASANRALARAVTAAGGRVLLDHRVRPVGSHHQKFVVVAPGVEGAADAPVDVAFVGGIDTAHSRRDGPAHGGDRQTRRFSRVFGPTPAWHDVQLRLTGPVVRDVETVFRQRWTDPARLTRWPWHALSDRLRRLPRDADPLPSPAPPAAPAGTCTVQLLRTYPTRRPAYPFAPHGERSVARGYVKALARARRLVYVEDQYLWSRDVARIFAAALRRSPQLRLIAVVPRYVDGEGIDLPASLLGQNSAWRTVVEAGGDRVQLFDLENDAGRPVYVHAKVCVIDDVWATVGSANLNRRSWTHDSELTAAVLDERRDGRDPVDPGGLGDGARVFARDLRLGLMREHLDRAEGDDVDLLDPDGAAEAVRRAAADLDAWHAEGCRGPRPRGRLRTHPRRTGGPVRRWLITPVYDLAYDPDGRPWRMRARRAF